MLHFPMLPSGVGKAMPMPRLPPLTVNLVDLIKMEVKSTARRPYTARKEQVFAMAITQLDYPKKYFVAHSQTVLFRRYQPHQSYFFLDISNYYNVSMVSSQLRAAVIASVGAVLDIQHRSKTEFKRKQANASRGRKTSSPLRPNMTFSTSSSIVTAREFETAFRMSKATFENPLSSLRPLLHRNVSMGARSKRTTISPDVRLGITLRLLAGAKIWDLVVWFHVKPKTFRKVFLETITYIISRLKLPGLPKNMEDLHKASLDFKTSRKHPSPFTGCIGCIDGIAVKIIRPPRGDHPKAYFNRKGFFAIPVQAVCDANYRFLCFSAICVGSTHDSLAHTSSKLGQYLAQGMLNGEFWIACDSAYVCTEFMIAPFPNSEEDEHQDAFNFFLSQIRIHIEQAFGMIVSKWSILDSALRYNVAKSTRIIAACMCLHNVCIDNKIPIELV